MGLVGAMAMAMGANAMAADVEINVGFENAVTEPCSIAVEKWAELVDEKSNGTMKLNTFPNSGLGKKLT